MAAICISPSVLGCDLTKLGEEVKRAESAGADRLHIDVMDGLFVRSVSFGDVLLKAVRRVSNIPFDVHLMVRDPVPLLNIFGDAAYITVHTENGCDVKSALTGIKKMGIKAGIALNPETPAEKIREFTLPGEYFADLFLVMTVIPGSGGQEFMTDMLPKIEKIAGYANDVKTRFGSCIEISADGGINAETAPAAVRAGANVLVSGSYLFNSADMNKAAALLRQERVLQ